MILAKGKLYDSGEQDSILASLEEEINETRRDGSLSAETVVSAVAELGRRIEDGVFGDRIAALAIDGIEEYVRTAARLLRRENIEYKLLTELGSNFLQPRMAVPPYDQPGITAVPMPLGTLFHIAAGNVDGLPAFSVAEGLLTGNVNILKLPQADNGLSVEIFQQLIAIEPELAAYIYVFDTPSADLAAMRKMAEMADGIVVWGGDAAVAAVRQWAPIGARLIEWGHRLSFAYIAGYEDKEAELTALSEHILSTRQLLCSSCQTIFLDTDKAEDLYDFCGEFLPYMERAALRFPAGTPAAAAEVTLRRYTNRLERVLSGEESDGRQVFQGRGSSLTACTDSELELSDLFGNGLVKCLPRKQLFAALRRHKGVLQTAGLLCPADQRAFFTGLLARAGVTRITRAGTMSSSFSGEAHDGEYALRRYIRMVDVES